MAQFLVQGNLNVRAAPTIEDAVVAVLDKGDIVAALSGFDNVVEVDAPPAGVRTWMRIEAEDKPDGWASIKNLTQEGDGHYRVTGGSGAAIRAEPSMSAAQIASLAKGDLVGANTLVAEDSATLATVAGRRWSRLDLPGDKGGWASMRFLSASTAGPGLIPREFVVTATRVNIRADASIDADIVGSLRQGDRVPEDEVVTLPSHRWMRVSAPVPGFVSMKWLSLGSSGPTGSPPWLEIARGEIGVKERAGSADNPRIVEYHRTTGLSIQDASQDETHWCSSFVNWCMERAGIEGTDSAMARSWLRFGTRVAPATAAQPGDIVVFSRGAPPAGHVGFLIEQRGSDLMILGGNQGNAVSVKSFPASRVIGVRRP